MATLWEAAHKIAAEAHAGKTDLAGRAYMDHVLRVANRQATEIAAAVALLHDTIEDTCVTAEALLAEGVPAEVVEAVVVLTHQPEQDYMEFIAQTALNPIARQVKIADLIDNMNLTRLQIVTVDDAARNEKYAKALQFLLAAQA